MKKPLVSVVMITYAHENFIEQAINGVLMQECNFDVELIIANDCSPDNTDLVVKRIIKNNPKASWIKYIKHKQNIGMMSNFIFALKQAQGKYLALCEGDDYWTDPLKLQKQVDFLENNPNYNICGHWQITVNEKGENIISENDPRSILTNLATRCVVFRNRLLKQDFFNHFFDHNSLGETFIYHYLSQFGKSIILPFHGAAYRISPVGVYSMIGLEKQLKLSLEGCADMQAFFTQKKQYTILEKITIRKAHFYNDYALLLLNEGKLNLAMKKNYKLNKELLKVRFLTAQRNKFININIHFYWSLFFKLLKK